MGLKLRAWLIIGLVTVLCGIVIWGLAWYRSIALTPAAMIKRLPAQNALVVYVDFAALRDNPVLRQIYASKVAEEPEYQDFVRKTQFDYKQDLDAAMVAFAPSGKYVFARGRFDWGSLRSYIQSLGGECYNLLCRTLGSAPDRHISFFKMQPNLLALAVSPDDDSAVLRMNTSIGGPDPQLPTAPIWLSAPASLLRSAGHLPEGTSSFTRSMERAENLMLTFAPEGERVAARLSLRCRNEQDASEIASELTRTTTLLESMITREHQRPNPADMSGVLTTGSFQTQGRVVLGQWRIERAFLENMLSGTG